MRKKVGIIIPFYDGDRYILKCINSIVNSFDRNKISVSVYVIDNNLSESQYINEIKAYLEVKFIKTNPKIGYGRACNIGASFSMSAGDEYLIFLNQDTYVYKRMIEELVAVLDSHVEMTICSPMIFDYENQKLQRMVIESYVMENTEYFTDTYQGQMKDVYVLPTIGAACLAMRKEVVELVGLYDPIYFMYSEDFDFIERVKEHKGNLLLVTKAKVAHFGAINEESPERKLITSLNYEISELIKKIRFYKSHSLMNFFIKNLWITYRINGVGQALKYLSKGLPICLNKKKYNKLNLTDLKLKIEHFIKKDQGFR